MTTLPEPDDDFDDSDSVIDDRVTHAIAVADHNDRWYYRNRNGRFWIREYERAGAA
jgi:hypothetical protein